VRSACDQTKPDIEIVIVVDGPAATTVAALGRVDDPRLRVIRLDDNQGPARARNIGVQAARAPWIAFLDDDDEWLPSKLSRQMEAARQVDASYPIINCLAIVDTPTGRFVFPRRVPEENEPLSEYLFVRRRSPFRGDGYLPTPGMFVPRQLLIELPFDISLRIHEDWDWLLRASRRPDTRIVIVEEPLCVVHTEEQRWRTGSSAKWRQSLAWARQARPLMTPRAYASFCLLIVGHGAAAEGQWRAFPVLLQEAIGHGRLTVRDLVFYVGIWLIPRSMRMRLRALLVGTIGWPLDVQGSHPRKRLSRRNSADGG
jgi:hypothetical protein